MTQSNGYQSFGTTEYDTVYRIEGSVEQVEALMRQAESDARSVRVSLSQIEAHLNTAVGIARDDYWASAGPVIASLQESD